MARIALLCGKVASGKSRFARELGEGRGFFHFSADEWMLHFYGEEPDRRLFDGKLGKCVAMIERLSERLLARGSDVVLDFGFWTRASRSEALRRFSALGHEARLVYFPIEAWLQAERVEARQREEAGRGYVFNEAGLRALNAKFEEPEGEGELSPDEYLDSLR